MQQSCPHANALLTELTGPTAWREAAYCVGPDSFSAMDQEPVQTRDVARLVVPRCGLLTSTRDLGEPYRLIDAEGAVVESVAAFLRELLAAGRSPATLRSYGMDLLRWWRFLGAVDVDWRRASRIEARDFSCWIQLTVKHRRRPLSDQVVATVESVGPPNPVTARPPLALGMRRPRSLTAYQLRGIWLQLRLSRCGTTTD